MRRWLYAAHGLGLICLLVVLPTQPWSALLLVPWAYSLHASLAAARRLPQLVWDGAKQWWWQGEAQPLRLDGQSYCSPQLVILCLRAARAPRRRYLLLLPDSLDEPSWRRLRVRLGLWQGDEGEGSGFSGARG